MPERNLLPRNPREHGAVARTGRDRTADRRRNSPDCERTGQRCCRLRVGLSEGCGWRRKFKLRQSAHDPSCPFLIRSTLLIGLFGVNGESLQMISDRDIWRIAHTLIEQHCEHVPIHRRCGAMSC